MPHKVSSQGAPRDRNIHLPILNSPDKVSRWILLVQIAKYAEANKVANNASAGERMHRRKAIVLLAQNMDTHFQCAQTRIVERRYMQMPVPARDKDISGMVVRLGCIRLVQSRRHPH